MKILLIILAFVLILGISIFWFFPKSEVPAKKDDAGVTFPVDTSATREQGQPIPDQRAVDGKQPEISKIVFQQSGDDNTIKLGGTIVASTYAIQNWSNENGGGEALLKYTSAEGWTLVSMGGGAWGVQGLVAQGVPQDVAVQLLAGRSWK